MRKILFIGVMLAINMVGAQPFTGFYTSRAFVLSADNNQLNSYVDYYNDGTTDNYIDVNRSRTVSHHLVGAYTDFGYSFLVANRIYLGFSIFAQLNEGTRGRLPGEATTFNAEAGRHIQEGSFTVQRSNFFTGWQFSPGFLITPNNLLYLNIGGEAVQMKNGLPTTCFVDEDEPYVCSHSEAFEVLPAETISKRFTLLQLGLGFERAISAKSQLFIRVDNLSHAAYQVERVERGGDRVIERTEIYTVKPDYWQFTFGIKRYF